MISKSFSQIALLALLVVITAPSSVLAQDKSSADRYFGYMDRNKDGRLDGEEMRRMPSYYREAFQRADFNLSNGMSRDQFVREMPRIMEDMRRRKEEEYRKKREQYDRSNDDRRKEDDRKREDDKKKSSYVYTPAKREPVTMKIPTRFQDGDTDKDGQIGLYEWRKWRPQEKYHFRVYDINGDGFLTPKELSIPPTEDELKNYLASIGVKYEPGSFTRSGPGGRSRDTRSRESSSDSTSPQPTVMVTVQPPQPVAKPVEQDRTAKLAMIFFKSMDQDKSGTITSEEWARSAKLKPKFEKAGYDLSQPMDQQQFIEAYRASEKS